MTTETHSKLMRMCSASTAWFIRPFSSMGLHCTTSLSNVWLNWTHSVQFVKISDVGGGEYAVAHYVGILSFSHTCPSIYCLITFNQVQCLLCFIHHHYQSKVNSCKTFVCHNKRQVMLFQLYGKQCLQW